MSNVVPCPGAVVSSMNPPLCVTVPYTLERPRPELTIQYVD